VRWGSSAGGLLGASRALGNASAAVELAARVLRELVVTAATLRARLGEPAALDTVSTIAAAIDNPALHARVTTARSDASTRMTQGASTVWATGTRSGRLRPPYDLGQAIPRA
jgi:hypothetical protein